MERIIEDSKSIIEQNKDIYELFDNTDKIIGYHFEGDFNPIEFYESLSLLGGDKFARLLIYSIRHLDEQDDYKKIFSGVDPIFVSKLKYLISKYKAKFKRAIDVLNNPYGWSYLNSSQIKDGSKQYLQVEVTLNNNKKIILRDEVENHLEYFRYVIEQIKEMKPLLSEDELDGINSVMYELKQELNDF